MPCRITAITLAFEASDVGSIPAGAMLYRCILFTSFLSMTSPVISTSIERILHDHLFTEIDLVDERILKLTEDIQALEKRKQKLINIATAAEIER